MEPVHLTQCGSCGKEATMKCAGCRNAPEYKPGDSVTTVYCSRDCQRRHWSDHKAHCRALGQRIKLVRAATILKAALLTYREAVYDIDLTKIELQDGALCLYQNLRSSNTPAKRGVFPAHLTTNIAHKEAALANNQCTTAMALLGRLTRTLLKGVASTIEVLDVNIGKPQTPTKLVPGPDSSSCPHTVLKVGRLSAEEVWILDTAGCQYGFQEVLVPYEKYLADKSCRISSAPASYDATETKDLDFFPTIASLNRTRAQREDLKTDRRARLHFADFVNTQISKDILKGSAAEFKDKLDDFVVKLKSHMLEFN